MAEYRGGKASVRNVQTPAAVVRSKGTKTFGEDTRWLSRSNNGLRDHLLNRIVVSPGRAAITGNGWSFTELEQLV